MGTRLPSAEEVLIIRPTGKRAAVSRRTRSFLPREPCQEAEHSKAGSERKAVQAECS